MAKFCPNFWSHTASAKGQIIDNLFYINYSLIIVAKMSKNKCYLGASKLVIFIILNVKRLNSMIVAF